MTITKLSQYFFQLETTSSRLAMTEILARLLAESSADEIAPVVNMSLGQLGPKFDSLDFQLAEKMVMRAMALSNEVEVNETNKLYKEVGDLGEVVYNLKSQISSLKSSELTILEVFNKLLIIARESGEGSQERKTKGLSDLLTQLDAVSAKFVVRMVLGKLRLGFSDMTILDALSWMEKGDKSVRPQLEDAYQLSPDIAEIARLTKKVGADKVRDSVVVKLGTPVMPALAQRLKTADEMIKKMGKVTVDPKYDGTRVQVHYRAQSQISNFKFQNLEKGNWTVRTFTRNLDETSHMFPELQKIGQFLKADEVILDCEAIGYNPQTGQLLPFQQTIQRKRKHGIEDAATRIPLKFFVFDILYKDGQSLVKIPLHQRIEILSQTVIDGELLEKTEFIVTDNPQEIRQYHADLLAKGLEGAMVKRWDGEYNPGRKGWTWVKFKEAEGSKAKLADTVDAVVMGLYVGKGKRASFGVGAFLIGVSGAGKVGFEEGNFYTISKVGTGLTDDQWRELKIKSEKLTVVHMPKEYVIDKNLEPDIWLAPGLVVEIAADEITNSPIHTAKLALRFPRLVKFRDDKSAHQATQLRELSAMV